MNEEFTMKEILKGGDVSLQALVASRLLMAISTKHDFKVVFEQAFLDTGQAGRVLGWKISVFSPKSTLGMQVQVDRLELPWEAWNKVAASLQLQLYNKLVDKFVVDEAE